MSASQQNQASITGSNGAIVREGRAYGALTMTVLFWSGNFAVARGVHELVSPFTLSFWRWSLAFLLLLPFALRHFRRDWPTIRRNWPIVIALSLCSVAGYNTFIYLALRNTTTINATLVNSTMPISILLLAAVILGERLGARRLFGVAISFTGVLGIIAHGDFAALLDLRLSSGDLWVLAATLVWGIYSVLLRWRPLKVHPLSLLLSTIACGLPVLGGLHLTEVAAGLPMALTPGTAAAVFYIAVFPSLLAYIFWNWSISQVGPSRAGLFIHLIPVFGAVWATLFLGERIEPFHMVWAPLILIGIYITTANRLPRLLRRR